MSYRTYRTMVLQYVGTFAGWTFNIAEMDKQDLETIAMSYLNRVSVLECARKIIQ